MGRADIGCQCDKGFFDSRLIFLHYSQSMKARLILCLLGAVILFLAGLGAGKTVLEGLKEGRIMSGGRRSSSLVSRESQRGIYWGAIGYNGVVSAGCIVGALVLLRKGFRR